MLTVKGFIMDYVIKILGTPAIIIAFIAFLGLALQKVALRILSKAHSLLLSALY